MLMYSEKHLFGTVTIEPDDDYMYMIINDLITHGYFVLRMDKMANTDIWCPNEWKTCGKFNEWDLISCKVYLVTRKISYTLPTKEAINACHNN